MTFSEILQDIATTHSSFVTNVVDPRHDPEDPNSFPDFRFYIHMKPDRSEEALFADRYQEYQVPVITNWSAPNKYFKVLVWEDRQTGEAEIIGNDPADMQEKVAPSTTVYDAAEGYFDGLKGQSNPIDNTRTIISWNHLTVDEAKKTGEITLMEELTVDSVLVIEFTKYAVWRQGQSVELRPINKAVGTTTP